MDTRLFKDVSVKFRHNVMYQKLLKWEIFHPFIHKKKLGGSVFGTTVWCGVCMDHVAHLAAISTRI